MNYNISFSRPYIPTDRAYWRGLIAFNSLLVQSCNVNEGDTFSPLHDRGIFLFLFLPSIPFRSTQLLSSALSRFRFTPSFPLHRSFDSHRHCLVVEIIIALFFSLRRRDRLTLMQPPIVLEARPREVLGSRPVDSLANLHAARRTYCYRNERPLISDHHRG